MNAQLNAGPARPAERGRLVLVDLLAMITLAIGVGIASAIVLGGTVLLLTGGDSQAITAGAALHSQAISRPGASS
jgi:hypothetical protein